MHQILSDYLQLEGVATPLDTLWVQPQIQRLSALCLVEHAGRLLLLQRVKEPFLGLWTAPGGKVQVGENPKQAVIRELWEETRLKLVRPRLSLIASELGPTVHYNWLCFMFHCTDVTGTLQASEEGILQWIPLAELDQMDRPEVDVLLFEQMLATNDRWSAKIRFSSQGALEAMEMAPID